MSSFVSLCGSTAAAEVGLSGAASLSAFVETSPPSNGTPVIPIQAATGATPTATGGLSEREVALALALIQSGGNRTAAFESVGISKKTGLRWIRRVPKNSVLAKAAQKKGRPRNRSKVLTEQLVRALSRTNGNRTAVARALGISASAICNRINRSNENWDAALIPFKDNSGRQYDTEVSDEELVAALRKTNGSRTEAAAIVGIAAQSIGERIHSKTASKALRVFRKKIGRSGPKPRQNDFELASALNHAKGGFQLASGEVSITRTSLCSRVRSSRGDNPLVIYKRYKGERGWVTLHAIAAAIDHYRWSEERNPIAAGAKAVGLLPSKVKKLIREAPPHSPLFWISY